MKIVDTLNVGDRMRFSLQLAEQLASEGENTIIVVVSKIEQDEDGLKVVWLQGVSG